MSEKDWAMLKRLGWIVTTAILAVLLWQTATVDPVLPRIVSGILLGLISLLAGLRLSADSAAAYMTDLQRTNKVLADQNRELEEANAVLLQQVATESATPSRIT
jgi:hypothetical protein